MTELVKERLRSFGYTVTEEDEKPISFCIAEVTEYIKNDCSLSSVPERLMPLAVDMVCGEFLYTMKIFDPDTVAKVSFEPALKEIQAGDTRVAFSEDATPEQRFDSFTSYLCTKGKDQLSCFRKLRW